MDDERGQYAILQFAGLGGHGTLTRTELNFGRGEQGAGIHFVHPTLGCLTISLKDDPNVRKAALYISQLYLLCEQGSREHEWTARINRVQQVMNELQQGANSSEHEPEGSTEGDESDNYKLATKVIEELVPVLYLMHNGDCTGEVFDHVIDRLGASDLFTTEYEPLGKP